jgi:hypothetical protein
LYDRVEAADSPGTLKVLRAGVTFAPRPHGRAQADEEEVDGG